MEKNPEVSRDLERVETLVMGLPTLVLSGGETVQELCSIFPGEELISVYSPDGHLGLDDQGFFVRQNGQIVFRGTRVSQQVQPGGRLTRFENLDTGQFTEGAPSFTGGGLTAPALLKAAPSQLQSSDYARIIASWRTVLTVSSPLGNPVYWA